MRPFARAVAAHFTVIAILFFITYRPSQAQNLVPNPSFETFTGCPTAPAQIPNCPPWFIPAGHGGSPDFHHVCGSTTFGVPSNVFGSQLARTGSGYIGFVTARLGTLREYSQVQLTSPLSAGVTYTVEAYVTLSDGSGIGTDGYQFYFSNTPLTGSGSAAIPVTPQVSHTTCSNVTDKINWVPVGGTFVASGGEQYMTIGNFEPDAATCQSTVSGWGWNYSYMDDISVTSATVLSAEGLELSGHWGPTGQAVLDWSTLSEAGTAHFELERSTGGLDQFEFVTELPAAGFSEILSHYRAADPMADQEKSHFYRVKLVNTDGTSGYSNAVELNGVEGEARTASLYPNWVRDESFTTLELVLDAPGKVRIEVWDALGKQVMAFDSDGVVGSNRMEVPVSELGNGYYFVKFRAGVVVGMERLVVSR